MQSFGEVVNAPQGSSEVQCGRVARVRARAHPAGSAVAGVFGAMQVGLGALGGAGAALVFGDNDVAPSPGSSLIVFYIEASSHP